MKRDGWCEGSGFVNSLRIDDEEDELKIMCLFVKSI